MKINAIHAWRGPQVTCIAITTDLISPDHKLYIHYSYSICIQFEKMSNKNVYYCTVVALHGNANLENVKIECVLCTGSR